MNQSIHRVAILGARGYSGQDLARILLKHPHAELVACAATDTNWSLADLLPEETAKRVSIVSIDALLSMPGLHTVFLATPVETSMDVAPKFLSRGVNVVDLSGAFRLPRDRFEAAYGMAHACPDLISKAHYGLVPFAKFDKTAPVLVSNPGCYVTSVLMALVPLLNAGIVDPSTIAIDAKSGATGAGRKAAETLLFTEVDGECLPYRIGRHQHLPEIEFHAHSFGGTAIAPFFTTTLLPVKRGITTTIFAKLAKGKTADDVTAAYAHAYENYALARVTKLDSKNERTALLLKRVVGTARSHIAYATKGDQLYVFSLLDNLMKGAASQAVENFNRILDVPVSTALDQLEGTL